MTTPMNCSTANGLDLVAYLDGLGFRPVRITRQDHWYRSPFREEKTASFKVNRSINRWFDFGEGIGGSLVDFGTRYFHCSVSDFLHQLAVPGSLPGLSSIPPATAKPVSGDSGALPLIERRPVQTLRLLLYLKQRRIPVAVAQDFCREIVYASGARIYAALGFPNDAGGYELRSEQFKGTLSPKAPTTIRSGSSRLLVFEGFFDFLSYVSVTERPRQNDSSYLILNSLAFLEKSRPLMDLFTSVSLFLDHDPAGEKVTQKLLESDNRFTDASGLYKGYKDLNEWVQEMGKKPRSGEII